MKQLTIIFLSCVLSISLLSAKEKNSHNPSVQHLINKVKNATGDQRRVAMNALKIQLRSMNQETRQRVMVDLQKSFNSNQHGSHMNSQKQNRHRTMQNTQMQTMSNHTVESSSHTIPAVMPHQPGNTTPTQQFPSEHNTPRPQIPRPQTPEIQPGHIQPPGGHR